MTTLYNDTLGPPPADTYLGDDGAGTWTRSWRRSGEPDGSGATASIARRPAAPAPDVAVRPSVDHVVRGYGGRVALADVDLDVPAGSLLAVIGPNGAGKSTLLKLIAGLLKPFAGTVEVLGGAARRRGASGSPTSRRPRLVDWEFPVTVGEVVMMGRVPADRVRPRRRGADDREAVAAALETVGMADAADRQIGALSGGQRRRVFLARALAAEPGPVPARRAGHRRGRHDPGGPDGRPRGRGAGRQDGRRHDPRPGLRRPALPPGGVHQRPASSPSARPTSSSTRRSWPRPTAATSSSCRRGERTVIDDAHHHDDAPAGERHFHDGAR